MTVTTTDLTAMRNYTEAIENLPDGAFLGSLIYFTVSQADVNLAKARRDLEDAGLDISKMKEELQPRHAFAKTARKVGKKFRLVDGIRSELMVRDLGEDKGEAYRHLILERVRMVNGEKRKVFYEKVGELIFTKPKRVEGEYVGDDVRTRRTTTRVKDGQPYQLDLTDAENDWLTEQLGLFSYNYDHLLNYMDTHAVRTFVREYIYKLRGVCVKESGGLYFVKQEAIEEARRLGQWVKSIDSQFHEVPLLNIGEQREMIAQALEEETIAEVRKMMAEVADILSNPDRKIEEATYEGYMHHAIDLSAKIQEYDNMLGLRAALAEKEIEIFQQQVLTLGTRIKSSSTMQARTVPSVGVAP